MKQNRYLRVLSIATSLLLAGCSIPGPSEKDKRGWKDLTVYSLPLPNDIGGSITYNLEGEQDGQRVIFMHGTPGDRGAWATYITNVPQGLQYLSIDRPAFGDSDPMEALPIMRQAEIFEKFLQTNKKGQKPILVGHSYGGTLAAIMAALYPDKIGAIVILAGSVSPNLDNPPSIQKVGQYPPFIYLLPSGLRKANDEVIALIEESKIFPSLWQKITIPVVVLQGEVDPLVSVKNVDYMNEKMTNAKLDITVLEGVNHFLPWNSVEHVKETINKALAYANQN